jgi:spermidine/putrescine-binding protein
MKNIVKITGLAAFALAFVGTASAQDIVTGKWQGQFDSQVGLQKYTYDFKANGTNLTGRAVGISDNGTNNVAITDGMVSTNGITFVELLKFGDNDVRIEYTGKVSGDEIKLHRKVGDFAEEDLVVKRVKAGDARPDAKADTNSPPAKP